MTRTSGRFTGWRLSRWLPPFVVGSALAAYPSARAPELRLHHIHVLAADPAAAMAAAVTSLGGTRAILQGHGPGVRFGDQYLIFDRTTGEPAFRGFPIRSALDAVLRWGRRTGTVIDAAALEVSAAARAASDNPVLAVAFVADDVDEAVESIAKRGTRADILRGGVARYALADGPTIELVTDADAPDAYWCPMHPDVRAARPSACPICGMTLVAIPDPAVGEYGMDVRLRRDAGPGIAGFTLAITEPASTAPVKAFATVHDRLLHLFIVGRGLEIFEHVHPELQPDGSFALDERLGPGEYMLIADFVPAGGAPQMLHRAILTPGYEGPILPPDTLRPLPAEHVVDGLRVSLRGTSLSAVKPSTLTFRVEEAATNRPVDDLQPYLGVPGHLLAVSPDLTRAVHAHPEDPSARGPEVTFEAQFAAGTYKVWVQFQRQGRVVTVPFVITVP